MRNKKGAFMILYLVFITLFICGLAIALYVIQDSKLANNLVSPQQVLELRDKKDIFEKWENETLIALAKEDSQILNLENNFCTKFSELDVSIRGFIFDKPDAKDFCLNLYNFKNEGSSLVVERNGIKKTQVLAANDRAKINFPVIFEFSFSKKYLINPGALK